MIFEALPPWAQAAALAAEQRMRDTYDLKTLYQNSTVENYRENLYYLALLETAAERAAIGLPEEIRAADVGASRWFYVQALNSFLRQWGTASARQVMLEGYEIDAYRVYQDFYSRLDHAGAHAAGLANTTYIPAAFNAQPGALDFISLFFPFVFPTDHDKWGLPTDLFQPQQLIEDCLSSLAPGGVLVVVNQGEAEHRAQLAMFETCGESPQATFEFQSELFSYDLPRFVSVLVKRD